MEEKVLIKGKFSKFNIFSFLMIASAVFGATGVFDSLSHEDDTGVIIAIGWIIISLVGVAFFYYLFNKCEITVTDKRVYGKAAFGRSVNLPFDMISSVGTTAFKGIGVATSSGRISFYLCQNSQEVFSVISNVLLERQGKATKQVATPDAGFRSSADELKKYKELLDSGVITQEEFDAKKKQILGL